MRPLGGVEVVELSVGIAAALCGKLLADAGANVTRVQLSAADDDDAPFAVAWQRYLHADKQSAEAGALDQLLGDADLVLTTSPHDDAPPGTDCDSLVARHPRLIAVCLTPFGQTGPYAGLRADDAVLSALCGLADATPGFPDSCASPDDPPVQSLAPMTEAAAALTAANAALGALLARDGGGAWARHVEVSAHEAAVSMMTYEWAVTSYGGEIRGRRPGPADLEPNCYVPCRDGAAIIVAFGDAQWRALVELIDRAVVGSDARFETADARRENWRELRELLAAWAKDKDGGWLLDQAQSRGLPCAPSFELRQTIASEHVRLLGGVRPLPSGPVPADPAVVNGVRRPPPEPGSRRTLTAPWRAAGTRTRPLEGVRILDLTQYVAGPFAGQLLASLGAEVVLVETSTRTISRGFGPFAGSPAHDAGSTFNHHNRGKRSVLLNLKTDAGRKLLSTLVRQSDVVLENFSRRAADALGVTYATLADERPDIILASISGLGRRGPWGGFVALHSGVILLSGLASVTRDAGGAPHLVGSTYPDQLTGAYTALLVQQALAARAQTGVGCHLEVSMLDVALTCMGGLVAAAAAGDDLGMHPVRFMPSSEPGRYVAIDGPERDCSTSTRREAMLALQAEGIRAGAVLDLSEVIADGHLHARGFVVPDGHPVATGRSMPGVPWLYDGARPTLAHAPLLGEGTREILGELAGLSEARLESLARDGVLV